MGEQIIDLSTTMESRDDSGFATETDDELNDVNTDSSVKTQRIRDTITSSRLRLSFHKNNRPERIFGNYCAIVLLTNIIPILFVAVFSIVDYSSYRCDNSGYIQLAHIIFKNTTDGRLLHGGTAWPDSG